jgi:hypothetical protein
MGPYLRGLSRKDLMRFSGQEVLAFTCGLKKGTRPFWVGRPGRSICYTDKWKEMLGVVIEGRPLIAQIKKLKFSQPLEAHACNPSYSGGRDQEDQGLKPVRTQVHHKRGWWNGSRCRP